jgi:hypothetical protein
MCKLLQEIADIRCAEAFGRLEPDQVTTLRRYHQLWVLLGESEFLSQPVSFTLRVSAKERSQELVHAGPTQLRSVVDDVRQFLMEKERTHFQTVRNVLRRNARARANPPASDEAVAQIDGIGKRYTKALKEPMMGTLNPQNPVVPLDPITAEQVVEDWVYGGSTHWDKERAARVARWSNKTYEYTLSKALHAFCDSYWELDILAQGILHEPSLTGAGANFI